jgi:hypothetical protein
MPIYWQMIGRGWDPGRMADSGASFFRALDRVRPLSSAGRETRDALAANPLPAAEGEAALGEIAAENPRSRLFFWECLLQECSSTAPTA